MTSDLTTKAAEIRAGLVAELRERTAFRFAGDCKCGKCQLVPRTLVDEAAALIEQQAAELAAERQRSDTLRVQRDGHAAELAEKAGIYDEQVTRAEKQWQAWETRATTAESERDELLREKQRHWVGIRECPQEPPGVLCYVAHGRAWFTTASIDKQWGDDWDDAPYEHNAGWPYSEPGVTLTAIAFDAGDLVTPEHEQVNSRWSVQDINAGRTPWLRSSPYGSGTARIMAGATFREFQHALLAAGGTAFTPWPIKEEDALRAEISRLESLAPLSARETARYLEIERRLSALENGPAGLADAHSKSPDQSERIAVLEAALSGMVRHAHETRGKSVEDAYAAARAALSQGLAPLGEAGR